MRPERLRQGAGPGEFALLHNIWVDDDSRVFICDRENDRIQIFDRDGNYLEEWTDLKKPGDIWVSDGVVHVVEQGEECGVSLWSLQGDLIARWRGNDGRAGMLISPHGLCVDSRGSIYVTEIGEAQRVTKFQRL